MSKQGSIREVDRIASEWLARRDSGHWYPADEARFQAWLHESLLHRVEFLRIEAAWLETRRMKALAGGSEDVRPPPPGQWNLSPVFDPKVLPVPKGQWRLPRVWSIAASFLVLGLCLLAWRVWTPGQQYSTPVGGIASVPMSDGSHVTLNTNTQIRVALSAAQRDVDLEQGEAFFEVAKDPHRPFVVQAGNKRVIAVGTRFSVRRDGDGIQVVVTEGKVRVEQGSGPLLWRHVDPPGSSGSDSDRGAVLLAAGTIAQAGSAGVKVQHKSLPEAEDDLSWRKGILMFRDVTLADAIAEFNRYNERPVSIADPRVGALKIEGNFNANNIAAFLELLQRGYPVKLIEEPNRYVLTAK